MSKERSGHPVSSQSPKLLVRMSREMRLRQLSYRTEQSYLDRARRYILFHGKRHPSEMGEAEVETFLTYLAADRLEVRPGSPVG